MTAANSTPLSDGASAVLLGSEEWAAERDLPVLAYITEAQTAAVDHVHKREGLLMAPAYAMPMMLDRAGLGLGDFDYYEIHEAFAAQVLCTLAAWEDPTFCKEKLGREQPFGSIDRAKLNVNGGSLAAGHPFAATGGRIVAGLAKQLHEDGKGRGVISICAAGGQGVVAMLGERRRDVMSDRYAQIVNGPVVSTLARQLGLPRPITLDRYRPGTPVVRGPVLCGAAPGGRIGKALSAFLDQIKAERAGAEGKAKALVFDATGIADSTELVELQRFFYPAVGRLEPNGRVVVLGTPPSVAGSTRAATAQRALGGLHPLARQGGGRARRDGAARARLRRGRGPARPRPCASCSRPARPTSPARWCGSARASPPFQRSTGSARSMARSRWSPAPRGGSAPRSQRRWGATAPRWSASTSRRPPRSCARSRPRSAARRSVSTSPPTDAPERIAEHFADGVDVVVHNAGVTRDRTIAKMPEERWSELMEINLSSEERINDALLGGGLLAANGRIVCVSSMSGIAGNSGQTNYATSKAGVIGMVEALAPELAKRGATINAVAPGFIETKMTAAMPIGPREAGRRMNSLSQGGLPVDVAETIVWLASPASTGINGNVVRVCGQSLLGA